MSEGTGHHYGSNVHGGDNVNIYGGSHINGIVKHQAPAPGLTEALARLEQLVGELRAQVEPGSARVLDSSSRRSPPTPRRQRPGATPWWPSPRSRRRWARWGSRSWTR
ncbi:hypothetical protein ACFQ60_39710 [Streptomyces zhihengii]